MNNEAAEYFSRELLGWYLEHKRDLPWRRSRDPYRIWVSEVMLQQTRVDTVIPYFERFMDKFPTVRALAEAPEEEVLKCWEGLGYYSRARNLQAGAREVLERHGGVIPDDKAALSALRGIGPYTAGAVMSIAFNRPEPAVDGNVMRVLSRFFCLEDDIAKPATRVKIEKLAGTLIPEGAARDFNQALMELGAMVCAPKSPGCLICPVAAHCEGRAAGKEHTLPVKTKAKPPRPETRLAALVVGTGAHAGQILVRQRPDSGLLARMWELPHVLAPQELAVGGAAAAKPRGRGRKAASKAAETPGAFGLDSGAAGGLAAAGGGTGSGGGLYVAAEAANANGLHEAAANANDSRAAAAAIDAGLDAFAAVAAASAVAAPAQAASGMRLREAQMDALCRQLAAEEGLLVRPIRWRGEAEHVFSHIVWDVQIFEAEYGFVLEHAAALEAPELDAGPKGGTGDSGELLAAERQAGYEAAGQTDGEAAARPTGGLPAGYRWIGPEHMRELAFPNVFVRILRDYWT